MTGSSNCHVHASIGHHVELSINGVKAACLELDEALVRQWCRVHFLDSGVRVVEVLSEGVDAPEGLRSITVSEHIGTGRSVVNAERHSEDIRIPLVSGGSMRQVRTTATASVKFGWSCLSAGAASSAGSTGSKNARSHSERRCSQWSSWRPCAPHDALS
jgi:hypothetical protein